MKDHWNHFLQAPPGKRFQQSYRRRKKQHSSLFTRILIMGAGVIITIAGIFFLPAPGPGTVIIFIGLGLIAQESLWLSMVLDKVEIYIRRIYEWGMNVWQGSPFWLKGLLVLTLLLVGAAFAYLMYLWFWS